MRKGIVRALCGTVAASALFLGLASSAVAATTVSVCTMATTDALNLRDASSLQSNVIGVIPVGASVEVYGMTHDGWYHVAYNGQEGYCYYTWLAFEGTAAGDVNDGKLSEMFATMPLNVRAQPNTSAAILGTIATDEAIPVTAKNNGWFTVDYNGQTGYCYGGYLGFVKGGYDPDSSGGNVMNNYTTTVDLNVRTSPNVGGSVIATIPQGTSVAVLASFDNGWVEVKYDGGKGYCNGSYLQ